MQPFSQHFSSLEEQPFEGPPGQFLVIPPQQTVQPLSWQSVETPMNQAMPSLNSMPSLQMQLGLLWQQHYDDSSLEQNMQQCFSQGWEQWPAQDWQQQGQAQIYLPEKAAQAGQLASDSASSTDRYEKNSSQVPPSMVLTEEVDLQQQLCRLLESPQQRGDPADDAEPDGEDVEPELDSEDMESDSQHIDDALEQDISNAVASFLAGTAGDEDESEQDDEEDATDEHSAQEGNEECALESSITPSHGSPQTHQGSVDLQQHQNETEDSLPSWQEQLQQIQLLQAQQKQQVEQLHAKLPLSPPTSSACSTSPASFSSPSLSQSLFGDATRSSIEGGQNSSLLRQQFQQIESAMFHQEQPVWPQQPQLTQLSQFEQQFQELQQTQNQQMKDLQKQSETNVFRVQAAMQQEHVQKLARLVQQQQHIQQESWQEQVRPQVARPPPGLFESLDNQAMVQIAAMADQQPPEDVPLSTGKADAESSKLTLAELVPSRTSLPMEEVHPCMRRGQKLAVYLKQKQLPPGITHEHIMILDRQVQHAVKALFSADKLPTLDAVQRMLRASGLAEPIVSAVLNVCAIYSNTYCLWVPPEGEISIVLLEEPLPSLEPPMVDSFGDRVAKLIAEKLTAKKSRMKVELQSSIPPPAESRPINSNSGLSFNVEEVLPIGTGRISLAGVDSASLELAVEFRRLGVTTLMMKNLPQNVLQAEVIEELNKTGLEGCYDFFYLPATFRNKAGLGYAFVNMRDAQSMEDMVLIWHNSHRLGLKPDEPSIKLSAATVQGAQNIKNFMPKMRRIRNPALKPLIIDGEGHPQT